jgi:ribosome recycling factor
MIEDLKQDAKERMSKALDALAGAFNKIRTGRAHPSILDGLSVDYYGVDTPLSQAASIAIEDARTLSVTPWEKSLVPEIEKAIMKSDLGLNPSTAGAVIRVPLPALTEETRKHYGKQAKVEAEGARISIRNIRRDVISDIKELQKAKDISEDEERRAQDDVQKITDSFVAQVEEALAAKEKDLMEI